MIAVVIGVFPLLGFGMQVATYFFDWGGPPDTYTTVTPGPASREKSTRFQPIEEGEHTMHMEIPTGVSEVRVKVRELRK